jgi:hypothetical protein
MMTGWSFAAGAWMPVPVLIEGLDSNYAVLCWGNGVQAALGPDGRWKSNRPATQKMLNERYSPIPEKYQSSAIADAVSAYAAELAMQLEADIVRYPHHHHPAS